MLAGNGFVYRSEETARDASKRHTSCRCIIVPGFGGNPQIEGYDPMFYYDQYREADRNVDPRRWDETKAQHTKRVMDEMKRLQEERLLVQEHELYRAQLRRPLNHNESRMVISDKDFAAITGPAMQDGAIIQRGTEEALKNLNAFEARAATVWDVIYLREDCTLSEVLEEVEHFYQYLRQDNTGINVLLFRLEMRLKCWSIFYRVRTVTIFRRQSLMSHVRCWYNIDEYYIS